MNESTSLSSLPKSIILVLWWLIYRCNASSDC